MKKKPGLIPESTLLAREQLQVILSSQLQLLHKALAALFNDYEAKGHCEDSLQSAHQSLLSSLRLLRTQFDVAIECSESWFEWTALIYPAGKK
jgi:hypothetical protein